MRQDELPNGIEVGYDESGSPFVEVSMVELAESMRQWEKESAWALGTGRDNRAEEMKSVIVEWCKEKPYGSLGMQERIFKVTGIDKSYVSRFIKEYEKREEIYSHHRITF